MELLAAVAIGLLEVVLFLGPLVAVVQLVLRWFRRRALRRDVVEHLGILTRRGLPLGPGIRALAREREESGHFWIPGVARREGLRLHGLAERLDAQASLSEALAGDPHLLGPDAVVLLRAAEPRGALAQGLEVLVARAAEADLSLHRAVLSLLPTLVVGSFVLSVCAFTEIFIIPKFKAIFDSVDTELPAATVLLLDLSAFFEESWYVVAGGLLAVAVLAYVARRPLILAARRAVHAVLGPLPGIGVPLRQGAHSRWLAWSAALLDAGSTLPEALDAARAALPAGTGGLETAARLAREGQPLEKVLVPAFGRDARELVPALLLSASADGLPEAGRAMARRLADRASRRLVAYAEAARPIPMLLVAAVVAANAFAIWGAIVKLEEAIVQ